MSIVIYLYVTGVTSIMMTTSSTIVTGIVGGSSKFNLVNCLMIWGDFKFLFRTNM